MALSPRFQPVSFAALPGWRADPCLPAFEAFRRSAEQATAKPYKTGTLGVEAGAFGPAFAASLGDAIGSDAAARGFFERWFAPCRIEAEGGGPGLVTSYYEPEVSASPVRAGAFRYPMYGRPGDLIDVTDENRPAGMDPYLAFARRTEDGPVEYHDRPAIERGALAGQGLEIAWFADPVELFFIHVQGAARLAMTDGSVRRVAYAAKSGQRFTGIGRWLLERGELEPGQVSMQSIRAWLKAHPGRIDEVLWQNRSFIFFRDSPLGDPNLGPVAAARAQLTAGRSIAVDRLLHTFGTPFHIDAPELTRFGGQPFRRLMIAQDTGSAITGTARGDLFAGTGDAAGEIAGGVSHRADFHALIPRGLVEAP